MHRRQLLFAGALFAAGYQRRVAAAAEPPAPVPTGPQPSAALVPHPATGPTTFPITRTDAQWRAMLTPQQYGILRQNGTEYPNTSPLLKEHRNGVYTCAGCGQPVFSSVTKFEDNTGWLSFYAPVPDAIGTREDRSIPLVRTEAAEAISATSSRMGRRRPICATASTGWP